MLCGLSVVEKSRGYSLVAMCGLLSAEHGLWGGWVSVVEACGLSSCRSWALRAQALWLRHTGFVAPQHVGSSQPGAEPVSPASVDGFFNH